MTKIKLTVLNTDITPETPSLPINKKNLKGFPRLLGLLLAFKLLYLIAISMLAYAFPSMNENAFHGSMQCWPREGGVIFASHYATWDAAHYLFLSEVGYSHGVKSCAFYPLWPLLMRGFSIFTGGNHLIAGMLLANLFSAIGWAVFYILTEKRFGAKIARWALIFLILFPGGLFFQFPYTEALFFMLLMLLWLGLETKQPLLIYSCAFLLPMTRAIGIFCIFPIAVSFFSAPFMNLWDRCKDVRPPNAPIPLTPLWKASFKQSWVFLAPFLGWATYFSLMGLWTGNPFEGFEAQKYWGVQSISNLFNIPKFLGHFFLITDLHGFTGSLLDRLIFLLFAFSLPIIWKLGKDLFVWALVLGLVPAMSGDFVSYTRFCAVAFPLFISLAVHFTTHPLKLKRYLIICGLLHLILLWCFVNFRWAG